MADATQRWLEGIAHVALERRRFVVFGILLALVVSAVALPNLKVSTSRYGLVSEDNDYQRRLISFFERFGYPDNPVMLVRGGTPEERRQVVGRMSAELQKVKSLEGRVFARMQPQDLAEVLLLQEPRALSGVRAALPPDASLVEIVEGGLPAWIGAVSAQLYAGLEGETSASEEQVAQGFETMAMMADALRVHLEGGDAAAGLPLEQALEGRRGVDERGYLATADGQALVINLSPVLAGDDVNEDFTPLVTEIRAVRDSVLADAPAGMNAELTGLPALAVDEMVLLKAGLAETTFWAGAGIFLFCLALFRSVRQTIVALMPLTVGIITTLTAIQLIYGSLNTITGSFVAVLLGLGIDFAVHVVARANEQRRRGADKVEAARTALLQTGGGIATGTVATAAAFLTTTTTEFTAYAELGVITAVGLVLIMLATFFLLPPLLAGTKAGEFVAPEPPLLGALVTFIRRARVPILAVGVLASVAGLAVAPGIDFDPRYFSFLPQEEESVIGLRHLEFDPLMSPVFANVTADSVEEARERAARLRELDSVAGVQSGTDLLPPLDEEALGALRAGFEGLERDPDFEALAGRGSGPRDLVGPVQGVMDALDEVRFALKQAGRPTGAVEKTQAAFGGLLATVKKGGADMAARTAGVEKMAGELLGRAWTGARRVAERGEYEPNDLPPTFRRRFASKDGSEMAVYAVPAGDFWQPEAAERFVKDLEAIDPSASGLAMNHHTHSRMIMEGFRDAAVYAIGLIIVVLLVDFRSVRDASLALAPTIMGWAWMLGFMAVTGMSFDTANIVCLPLVLGIGIAFGVHLMHRCRESVGDDGLGAVDDIVRGTGGAVMVAALTTMVGFGALMLVDYKAMVSVGVAMVLGIACCLVASLVVLPALLLTFRRAR